MQKGAITRYAAAIGYSAPEYAVTLHGLGNGNVFSASYYHRVSKDVEAGAKAVYDVKATSGGVALEVGAKAYVQLSSQPASTAIDNSLGLANLFPAILTLLLS